MNRIENELMGPRMSTNVTVPRQTPNTEFGARVQSGVTAAADVVSSAGSLATGMFAGRGIISAAVSSLGTFSHASSSGAVPVAGGSLPYTSIVAGGEMAAGGHTSSGVTSVPGTVTTTVDGGASVPGATLGGQTTSYYPGTNTSATVGQYNGEMAGMFDEQKRMLSLQIAMQRENQIFTTVSNVLKTRHDTAKNAISNIR